MLRCCRQVFKPIFSYIFSNGSYRRVEYGICPNCGCAIFRDYKQFSDGSEKYRDYTGKKAKLMYEKWQNKLNHTKYGSFSNNNFYFGDSKKIGPKIFYLRKNFNNQSEVLEEVKTKVYYG